MYKVILVSCMLFPSFCFGNDLSKFVISIQNKNVSIQDINALAALDKFDENVGYGLCVAAGGTPNSTTYTSCNP